MKSMIFRLTACLYCENPKCSQPARTFPNPSSPFNLFNLFNPFPCAIAALCLLSPASAQSPATKTPSASNQDAATTATTPISVPVNQVLTPAGIQVELPG